MYIKCRTL